MSVYDLPLPPSVNNLFFNAKGRGGRIRTPLYNAWATEAGWEVARQRRGQPRVIGPVSLAYEVSDRARFDLGNSEKALTDLLVSTGVIQDDNKNIVRKISLEWSSSVNGVRVTITSM